MVSLGIIFMYIVVPYIVYRIIKAIVIHRGKKEYERLREEEQRRIARYEEEKARKEVHRNTYGPHRFTLEYSYNDTLEKVDIESGGQKILNNSPEDKLFFETVNKYTPNTYSIFFDVQKDKFPNVRLAMRCYISFDRIVIIITNKAVYRYNNNAESIDKIHDYIENKDKCRHRASGYMQPIQYAQKLLSGIYKEDNYTYISKDVFGDSYDLTISETYLSPSLRSKVNPSDIKDILAAALAD